MEDIVIDIVDRYLSSIYNFVFVKEEKREREKERGRVKAHS